jgi:hypothetical protein
MVGLKRVLHAQQKSKAQNSEHVSPNHPTTLYGIRHGVCQSKVRT